MKEKVLLIDDEKEFVETLGERMKARGMDVSSTVSPKEGLDIVEKHSFDAIVLDLKMPEMDGMEVLKRIRSKNPDIQVILLTGNATIERGIEAMKLGAMDLIEKPVDIATLTEKIKKAQAHKMILVEKRTQEKIEKIISSKSW
jgi:DNA-binding NtrC family response regulator